MGLLDDVWVDPPEIKDRMITVSERSGQASPSSRRCSKSFGFRRSCSRTPNKQQRHPEELGEPPSISKDGSKRTYGQPSRRPRASAGGLLRMTWWGGERICLFHPPYTML